MKLTIFFHPLIPPRPWMSMLLAPSSKVLCISTVQSLCLFCFSNLATEWKHHITTPLFKKGNPTSVTNYRPISLRCAVQYPKCWKGLPSSMSQNMSILINLSAKKFVLYHIDPVFNCNNFYLPSSKLTHLTINHRSLGCCDSAKLPVSFISFGGYVSCAGGSLRDESDMSGNVTFNWYLPCLL